MPLPLRGRRQLRNGAAGRGERGAVNGPAGTVTVCPPAAGALSGAPRGAAPQVRSALRGASVPPGQEHRAAEKTRSAGAGEPQGASPLPLTAAGPRRHGDRAVVPRRRRPARRPAGPGEVRAARAARAAAGLTLLFPPHDEAVPGLAGRGSAGKAVSVLSLSGFSAAVSTTAPLIHC